MSERPGHRQRLRSTVAEQVARLRASAFPDRWSLFFGQVALHSFIVVAISGAFLMFFYDPSNEKVTYDGPYVPLIGIEMSRAYESMLNISFEVHGGLLMRNVHHWAAMLMVAALTLHLLRLFFTGGFRKPRKLSWLVSYLLLITTMAASFTGSKLPDDLMAGTSLAVLDGVLLATPIVGTRLSSLVFDGSFPGDVISRFYPLHVAILPAVLVLLFVANAVLTLIHGHAQHAGPGRTNRNVVGRPLKVFAVKSAGLFFIVSAVALAMATTFAINPVWEHGPSDPASAAAGASPDWYLAFLDGAQRLVPPGWEFVWSGNTWTLAVLIPVLVGTLFLVLVAGYPFAEEWITGGRVNHHLLERPRNNPTRTGLGVAGLVFYGVLSAAGASNTLALRFGVSVEGITATFRVLVVVGPILGFAVTKRIALGLQRRDRQVALHGHETGQVVRLPNGGFSEVHRPVDVYERWRLVSFERHTPLALPSDAHGLKTLPQRLRVRLSRLFYSDQIPPLTRSELRGVRNVHVQVQRLPGGDQQPDVQEDVAGRHAEPQLG